MISPNRRNEADYAVIELSEDENIITQLKTPHLLKNSPNIEDLTIDCLNS